MAHSEQIRQTAPQPAQSSVKRESGGDEHPGGVAGPEDSMGLQKGEGDRQVEPGALFAYVGRVEVDRGAPWREIETGSCNRDLGAFGALASRGSGQSQQLCPGQSSGEFHLDAHGLRGQARKQAAMNHGMALVVGTSSGT